MMTLVRGYAPAGKAAIRSNPRQKTRRNMYALSDCNNSLKVYRIPFSRDSRSWRRRSTIVFFMAFDLGAIHELAGGRSWDRQRLWAEVSGRVERNRAAHIQPGDRVLLLAANTLEFFAELLAVWVGGATAVPVDAALTGFELDNLAAAADPRLIVVTGRGNTPAACGVPVVSTYEASAQEAGAIPSRLKLDDEIGRASC